MLVNAGDDRGEAAGQREEANSYGFFVGLGDGVSVRGGVGTGVNVGGSVKVTRGSVGDGVGEGDGQGCEPSTFHE